jgi:hypothetical protein
MRETLRSERVRATMRASVAAVLGLTLFLLSRLDTSEFLTSLRQTKADYPMLGLVGGLVVYELGLRHLLGRLLHSQRRAPRPLRYVNAGLETTLPTLAILLLAQRVEPIGTRRQGRRSTHVRGVQPIASPPARWACPLLSSAPVVLNGPRIDAWEGADAWYEDFVIHGRNEEAVHKTGRLVDRNCNRQKELLTLTLSGLGIFKISAATRVDNEDKIASVTCEMYCECENITSKFT